MASAEARRNQLDKLLDPWGASEVTWVKDHCLIKAQKVYLNSYDLLQPQSNWALSCLGLGGAYHAGIELLGQEYAFGGHYSEEYGIFNTKPLFQQRQDLGEQMGEQKDAEELREVAQHFQAMPKLRSRVVIGWWRGTEPMFEDVLRQLKEQSEWTAPTYRLLSRNCNHFVRALCEQLLNHECFHPLPGSVAVSDLVPNQLTRLTDFVLCCCPSFLSASIDSPMLHAPWEMDLFQGKALRVGRDRAAAAAARASQLSRQQVALPATAKQRPAPAQQRRTRPTLVAVAGNLDAAPQRPQPQLMGRFADLQVEAMRGSCSPRGLGFGSSDSSRAGAIPANTWAQQLLARSASSPRGMSASRGSAHACSPTAAAAPAAQTAELRPATWEARSTVVGSTHNSSSSYQPPSARAPTRPEGAADLAAAEQQLALPRRQSSGGTSGSSSRSSLMAINTPQRFEQRASYTSPAHHGATDAFGAHEYLAAGLPSEAAAAAVQPSRQLQQQGSRRVQVDGELDADVYPFSASPPSPLPHVHIIRSQAPAEDAALDSTGFARRSRPPQQQQQHRHPAAGSGHEARPPAGAGSPSRHLKPIQPPPQEQAHAPPPTGAAQRAAASAAQAQHLAAGGAGSRIKASMIDMVMESLQELPAQAALSLMLDSPQQENALRSPKIPACAAPTFADSPAAARPLTPRGTEALLPR